MTFDTSPLERDCVLLNCSRPAVDPTHNRVHCATHDPNPPPPPRLIGQDPDTMEPVVDYPIVESFDGTRITQPPPLDPSTMEPYWDGTQWVLRAKRALAPHVDRQELTDLLHRLRAAVTAVEGWLE
jgi:hypothetical protein